MSEIKITLSQADLDPARLKAQLEAALRTPIVAHLQHALDGFTAAVAAMARPVGLPTKHVVIRPKSTYSERN